MKKNFLTGDNCKLGYYVDGADEDFETQDFEFGKKYELHLKVKAEFLRFDNEKMCFCFDDNEVYIKPDEIQKVYEV